MKTIELHTALQNPNVAAFLRAIRLGEGTTDEAGYYRIVGGGSFKDDQAHPKVRVWIDRYKVWSTAAGAYQIIYSTWKGLQNTYNFPDFTPESQDLAAIALIYGRGALPDVMAGYLSKAIDKCAPEWASLPGSLAGQRTESYASVEKVFLNSGGKLA